LKKKERGISKDQYKITPMTGTRRYIAPEVFHGYLYGAPADVFSFTVLVWSVISLEVPYKNLGNAKQFETFVFKKDRRPCIKRTGSLLPKAVAKELLEKGWARDPSTRPTMKEFGKNLRKVYCPL